MMITKIQVIQFKEYIARSQGIRQFHKLGVEGSSPSNGANITEVWSSGLWQWFAKPSVV